MIKSISEIYKNELNNVSTVYCEVIELWLKCKQDLHEEAIVLRKSLFFMITTVHFINSDNVVVNERYHM